MKILMSTYRSHIMWVFDRILIKHIYKIERDFLKSPEKWGDYIYETLFSSIKNKKVTIQEKFCIKSVANVSRITFYGSVNPSNIPFLTPLSEPKLIPVSIPRKSSLLAYFVEPPRSDKAPLLVLRDHPVWYELRDEVVAYNKTREDVERKCTNFHNFVDGLCDYYETVEEAVVAWPALKFLLPEWAQTHLDFVFDGTPKPLPEGADIAEITAMIVSEKLEV